MKRWNETIWEGPALVRIRVACDINLIRLIEKKDIDVSFRTRVDIFSMRGLGCAVVTINYLIIRLSGCHCDWVCW